ncbi:hypothetical protein Poli38472_002526 [Pythium oligandrum]|uniref:BZIP domain-containing protein n=1 Tax=Pythium oligandrum TaxID=41045 RepID=A0A8K1FH70_PYTOL|nr:hypothetical protein Poli38472_002526 [Pythium oligandrum]|eukprot:TMW63585.1 hypothetical protein Poli38472_002526 [Pythium oligandrum]
MAFVFGNGGDELYPFLGDDSDVPLSPDDQALLLGMYPSANLTDFDFTMMGPNGVQMHHVPAQSRSDSSNNLAGMNVGMEPVTPTSLANERNNMTGLVQPTSFFDPRVFGQHQENHPSAPSNTPSRYSPGSTSSSPSSAHGSDPGLRDSEDILNAPVKSLTEEEKKLRRRAQVAKSARKHRNRQKEELSRLREQVQFLQEQMAAMRVNGDNADADANAITIHRKRKKVDDVDIKMEATPVSPSQVQAAPTNALIVPMTIPHWFHHLPVDTLERSRKLHEVATRRSLVARQILYQEFGSREVQYPQLDIKLNSNGPDMEIRLIRAKSTMGFTHHEVAEAAWDSIFNFNLEIPPRFKRYVTSERLMELDENTRYGRTISPLMKTSDGSVVYSHCYHVVHRVITDDCVIFNWESIDVDDMYPFEGSDTAIRNDEVGCTIMETEYLPNGKVQTLSRTIIHSTPPVAAISEPQGRLNEAFLTVFCRSADIMETSARLLLRQKFPDRIVKPEFEYVNK